MTKKQKKTLKRIIAAAVLTVLLALLLHFVELPWFVQLVLWLVPYLVIAMMSCARRSWASRTARFLTKTS